MIGYLGRFIYKKKMIIYCKWKKLGMEKFVFIQDIFFSVYLIV